MADLTRITTNGGVPFTVDAAAAEQFKRLLNKLEASGYPIKSNESGGYNYRNIAGTRTLSRHATGDAVDVNWDQNARGTKGNIDPALAKSLASEYGMTWGGTWKNPDPMHFEVARRMSFDSPEEPFVKPVSYTPPVAYTAAPEPDILKTDIGRTPPGAYAPAPPTPAPAAASVDEPNILKSGFGREGPTAVADATPKGAFGGFLKDMTPKGLLGAGSSILSAFGSGDQQSKQAEKANSDAIAAGHKAETAGIAEDQQRAQQQLQAIMQKKQKQIAAPLLTAPSAFG